MSKDDGGPAFPTVKSNKPNTASTMRDSERSKRDWFAGMAMAGIAGDFGKRLQTDSATASAMAYCFADAMLAESNKERGAK